MQTFVLTVHLIACIFLIVLVLLQSGKEGMGVIFGGGSSSLFGSSGAGGFLVKFTAVCAGIFLITSLSYAYFSNATPADTSIMDNVDASGEATAPLELPTEAPLASPANETQGGSSMLPDAGDEPAALPVIPVESSAQDQGTDAGAAPAQDADAGQTPSETPEGAQQY